MGFDYYKLLEITPSASDADIKKAYVNFERTLIAELTKSLSDR